MPSQAQLPRNQVQWHGDPSRAALLIHDMQRYFVDFFPAGEEPVTSLVENIAAIRAAAVTAGMPVFYTAQPGAMTPRQRGLLMDMWGPGMGNDPQNRPIIPVLAPQAGDTVLTKWRYSAFYRSELETLLRRSGRDQLIICGIYAHVGVLITACDAFTRDFETFLVADAIADFTPEYHMLALNYAAERCATTVCTAPLLADLTVQVPFAA
jgi:bifunctional isochorismate lyase/aryl carrier protein